MKFFGKLLDAVLTVTERTPVLMFSFFFFMSHSWQTALAIVGTIVAHELNHAAAFKWLGVGVKKIRFDVLMAATEAGRPVRQHLQLALSALAGPAGGLIEASLLLLLWLVWPSSALLTVAAIVASVNLFNCAPVVLVDGGRVWHALISRLGQSLQVVLLAIPFLVALGAIIWFGMWFTLVALGSFLLIMVVPALVQARRQPKVVIRPLDERQPDLSGPLPEPPPLPAEDSDKPVELAPLSRRHLAPLAAAYLATAVGLLGLYTFITSQPGFSWHIPA